MSANASYRGKQLVRVLRLMRLLQLGRWNLSGLSQELAVSERTIRRDLAAIEEAHIKLEHHRGEYGEGSRWSLHP